MVAQIIIHTQLELKATAIIKLTRSIENLKNQQWRILCNRKEVVLILIKKKVVALRVSTKTMAPIDLQETQELTAAETLVLPRWRATRELAGPQIIYKMMQKLVEEMEATLIV